MTRNWLREIRKQSGYDSCEKLANQLGISGSHYTNIENGNRTPKPHTAKLIAKSLNFKKYGYDWTKFYSLTDQKEGKELDSIQETDKSK
ncbi:helix-turn-helix domain-containing protein [Ruminiclostridium papyrosolvens]|uniref:XRE family transcriptional regulator n=1 Tax=Ruminiclostridium papyrosolvens C7 TaxID=1330534 RepID=U4R2L1_9FIRM|nr:helix-turn-helix transcriptional regulator [Ruminiclostridium papyrosolvens]EPR11942.1 XRE family transcriptional regulator [Ruminiclostridium papyrosolvens C7]